MKLALFRHAEKENISSNPALSPRGLKQSEFLKTLIEKNELPLPQYLWSSPKIRAVQTFQKLSENKSLEIDVMQELEERSSQESSNMFSKRVKNFLQRSSQINGTVFLCTHYDWIEEALIYIPSDTDLSQSRYHSWRPGAFMLFEISNELWHLEKWGGLFL